MDEVSPLAEISKRYAVISPTKTAIVFEGDRISYAALHDRIIRTAGALRAAGIGPGDRVGWLALNHPDYIVLMQAAFRVGAVLVAISTRLLAREIAFIGADAGIKLLVTHSTLAHLVDPAVGAVRLIDAAAQGEESFAAWSTAQPADELMHQAAPGDVALQLYTSGTTGLPKGVLLTHANLIGALGKGAMTGENWGIWDDTDVSLVAMPLFHIGGTGWVLSALVAGATMVLLAKPDIAEMIAAIRYERVTKLFAVPTVLSLILDHPMSAEADCSSVTDLLYGASPISAGVLRRSMQQFPNAEFVQCYGATETTGTVVYLPAKDHHPDGTRRMSGCGKALPGNEVRILKHAGAAAAAPGEIGEIAIRSVSVMAGYHNQPDASAAVLVDGWYLTGDAGFLDQDGYLFIHDRVKDMIVSGGENIYPVEIEKILQEHPCVHECAVIGVPDARWGEAVKAIIVRAPGSSLTEQEIITFTQSKIAAFKVPKSVDFLPVLPRNASGKILKKELRALYWPAAGRQVG